MRRIMALFLSLAMLLLVACRAGDSQVESSPALEPSSPAADAPVESSVSADTPAPVNAPEAQLATPGQITVYVKSRDSDLFTGHVLPVQGGNITLMELVAAVEGQLGVEIPVLSVTQQKGMVTVNLAGSFPEDYTKGQMEQILTTLAATLQQNHRTFEWIQYQLEGEVGIFGEEYPIPPLKLLEGDPEEFAAIRAQIPYEGLQQYPVEGILETDETGQRLAEYLSLVNLPYETVSSLSDLANEHKLRTSVSATRHYETYEGSDTYRPELKPLEAPASELIGFLEQWFWLKEHVEESAKLLYGEDVSLVHGDFGKYRYLELLGVYTPPHMGGGGQTIPVIFEYEDLGDRLQAEIAYVVAGMEGYVAPLGPGEWEDIPQDQLEAYLRDKARRYEVVVQKLEDGRFLLESQRPLS